MTSVYESISDLAAKNSETPQQIIGKLKKSDQNAIKALDVTSFEEIAQQLEHLTSIGSSAGDAPAEGTDSIDRSILALALPILTLTRSVAQIIDIFDNDVSKFVADTDHKLNNLFPAMQERFCGMVAKCRGHHQDALRVLADVGTNENREQLANTNRGPRHCSEAAPGEGCDGRCRCFGSTCIAQSTLQHDQCDGLGFHQECQAHVQVRGWPCFVQEGERFVQGLAKHMCLFKCVCVCVVCSMAMSSAPLIVCPRCLI